jgi:hypothetical protein
MEKHIDVLRRRQVKFVLAPKAAEDIRNLRAFKDGLSRYLHEAET